jgi:hypothetical protein
VSVPIAAVLGVLSFGQLVAVAFATGCLTLVFGLAWGSYLPVLVPRERLVDANARLMGSQATAEIAGPSIAAALVQAATAPFAIVLDACSFLASAFALHSIGAEEPPLRPARGASLRRDLTAGLRFVGDHPLQRAIAGSAPTLNFFAMILWATVGFPLGLAIYPLAAPGEPRWLILFLAAARRPRPFAAGGARRLVERGLPALEHGRLPVGADRARPLDPGAELGLGELRVLLLELDAVGVAGLQVLDQHLARDLVLAALRDREVDPQERVRVAVEDGRDALLDEEVDVLEPVDVLARRGGEQVDVLDQAHVLLVGESLAGEVLGVEALLLLGLAPHAFASPFCDEPTPASLAGR